MTPLQQLRFATRSLGRDLKAGELRVLALALVIAVASVTAIGFFTDRVGRAMTRQAADVLAADLLVTAGLPVDPAIADEARRRGLAVAEHIRFPSVVINDDDESQLVAVKAVSDGYPLRGRLQTVTPAPSTDADAVPASDGSADEASSTTRGADRSPAGVPAPGTVWVDSQLQSMLGLHEGSMLALGAGDFRVTRVILYEPDRGENVFEIAPRVMMNVTDLDASGLLGEGSRARFTVLMAGDIGPVDAMQAWLKDNHADEVRIQGVRDGSPQLQRALDRAERFLGLASVVTVLLAGAAIALSVRHFAQLQADGSAVLRTLGASRGEVVAWLLARLAAIALLASLVGVAIGWLAQRVLADLLSEWFTLALPAPGWQAPLIGVLTAFIAVGGFGLLPVLRAGRVPVMQVLQRNYEGLDPGTAISIVAGLVATFLVVWLQSRDALLTAIVVGGVVLMLLVFAVFGRGILVAIRRLAGARYRLSVAGLHRRAGSSIAQLSAFAMGILALLLISIVRVDLLAAWERDLPPDVPNVFVINIQPDQADGFAARLDADGIEHGGLFPMVRARLVSHNGMPVVGGSDEDESRDNRRARRTYNLTWSDTLPASNTLTDGQWWAMDGSAPPALSIESEWAAEQGYAIGDTLTFDVAGVSVSAPIVNLRAVDWESFEVNFFVIASPATLAGLPSTYVTSFHIDGDFMASTTAWAREFPGIATLNVGAIIDRVKALMDKASTAVEYVFLFTLLAGVSVLLAAVQSSQAERIRESALLRAIGASHRQVRSAVVTEFAILGAIAGFLAALFSTIVAWALSHFIFELPFSPNPWLWLLGVLGGAAGIAIAGFLATRQVLYTPPLVALRQPG